MIHLFFARVRALLLACLALATAPQVSAEVVQPELFGLHVHGMARGGDWPGIEFGYLRLWDAGVLWRDLEPTKGEWKFGLLDRYVDEAQKHGVKLLLTLGQTPKWAASQPDAHSPYGDGASSDPRSMDDWRSYVETLAKRYKGRIHAWEIWNEVNVKHFYRGDFVRLVEMEKIASEVLKSVDPTNIVLTPSIQGGAFRQLNAYFQAGGGRHADAISYHFYALTEEPEILPERIRKVREVMTRHGLADKPLWNTEIGWLIPNSDGGFGRSFKPAWIKWRKPQPIEAAGFIVRSYLHCLNGGIRHVFWYAWDNGAMGLAENKGTVPKPAAVGFTRAQKWLVGSDFRGCNEIRNVWRCELFKEGKQQWIVWSEKTQGFKIPEDWKVAYSQSLFDPIVTPLPLYDNVIVSPQPMLLK